jgi:aminopeptidase N
MDQKSQSFEVPLSGPNDYLKINAGQQALVRVAHSTEMTRRLQSFIRSKEIGTVDRAGLLLDAYALTKAGYASPEGVVDLLRALVDEDNSTVWSAMSGVMAGLHILLEAAATTEASKKAFQEYTSFCGTIVKRALALVGWDAKEGEGHPTKLLRGSVIALLDVFCSSDAEVVAEARRRFDAHWTDATHTVLPSEYKSTVFKVLYIHTS